MSSTACATRSNTGNAISPGGTSCAFCCGTLCLPRNRRRFRGASPSRNSCTSATLVSHGEATLAPGVGMDCRGAPATVGEAGVAALIVGALGNGGGELSPGGPSSSSSSVMAKRSSGFSPSCGKPLQSHSSSLDMSVSQGSPVCNGAEGAEPLVGSGGAKAAGAETEAVGGGSARGAACCVVGRSGVEGSGLGRGHPR